MADVQVTPRKRQKVSVACEPCRTRKTKCDGRPPVCGPCRRRGGDSTTCEWDHGSPRGDQLSLQSEYIRNLETRLNELQQRVQPVVETDIVPVDKAWTRPAITAALPCNEPVDLYPERQDKDDLTISTALLEGSFPLPPTPDGSPASEPQLSAMLGPSTGRSPGQNYCWSSSARSFMHHIHKVAGKTGIELPAVGSKVPLYPNDEHDDEHGLMDYVLPERKTADSLLDTYWRYVHTLYPLLGKRKTMGDYQALWDPSGIVPHERSFHCLVNIIFALSSQISPTASLDERARSAAAFYQRAQSFLSFTNTSSVRNVQIYLLFGLYLQSTNQLHDCWIFVGLAIRTAQSLDLHLAETSECHPHIRQRSILRRVWYGCVLMDRDLAMISGRPCTIHLREALAVDHPISVEGEKFPAEPTYPSHDPSAEKPTIVDFFNNAVALSNILYDILRTFYTESRTTPTSPAEVYDKNFGGLKHSIPSIDERLSAWERALPQYLRMQAYSQDSSVTQLSRLAVILRQRFLHVRILLLRPVLSALIALHQSDDPNSSGMLTSLSQRARASHRALAEASEACFQAAQEAIRIVHFKLPHDPRAISDLSSWWHNILFVYTAATVVIAARLRLSVFSEITESDITDSCQQAISIIQRYSVFGASIAGMVTTLQLLYDAIQLKAKTKNPAGMPVDGTTFTEPVFDFNSMSDSRLLNTTAMSTANTTDSLDSIDMLLFDPTDTSWLDNTPFQM